MKRSANVGPTIQSRPDCCPSCDSRRIIKRGLRRNCHRQLQIYWCKDCGRYFASLMGLKGVQYPPRVIMRALCLYHLGFTHGEVARRILAEHHLRVPRRTVSNWVASFREITTFQRLRPNAVQAYGQAMLQERILNHRQEYRYQVHRAKLALTANVVPPGVAAKMEDYLLNIFGDFPDHLFRDDDRDRGGHADSEDSGLAVRSSQSQFGTLPVTRAEKQNLANDLAALGLLLARKNRDRHPCVQEFMLANDSCTIACEVPVYLTAEDVDHYRSVGFFITLPEFTRPVTGHIDVIQARNGFIHLLDYKPNARLVEPVEQLVIYALALGARTGLPIKIFKCAWFDEKDYFEFSPLHAVMAKRAA